jgi:eukaryotic-like serine/threonine-protein kinase
MAIATGTRLGAYEVQSVIGSGGMGKVYRAVDTRLDRAVAIKVVTEFKQEESSTREQLLREARIASKLNHPNICTIYEVGQSGDVTYIVMEYVGGRTLNEVRGGRGLDFETVVRYGVQMAGALEHAHEHGIIHRDLKAENIVVTSDDRIKVLDFGLAEHVSVEQLDDATMSDSLVSEPRLAGTLAYMAPEVLLGKVADLRADIWALGVVLYELASGQLPFRGNSLFEISSAILKDTPTPLRDEIPAGLRNIIQHCLQKEPAQRYQHCAEIAAALEGARFATAANATSIDRRSKRAGKTIESIAVLPFANPTGEAETEYLCDGITETIINSLSQIPKLRVIPRSTVFRYKNREFDIQTVGKELEVRAVLGGRVLQRGGSLTIATELVDLARNAQVWGQRYNRKMQDLLAIQEEISEEIFQKLRIHLTPEDKKKLLKLQPTDTEAYRLYLKGRHFLNRRSAKAFASGIDALRQATTRDPYYALAYSGLADAHLLTAWWESVPTGLTMQQVRVVAQTALKLDNILAEPHTSLGLVKLAHDWDWEEGLLEMRRATDLNPVYTQGYYWRGLALCALGRMREGGVCTMRAHELEPLNALADTFHGVVPHYFNRNFDQVIRALDRVIEMNPDVPVASFFRAMALFSVGRIQEAITEAQRGVALSGHLPLITGILGLFCGTAGHRDRAQQIIGELQAQANYVPPLPVALTFGGMGEMDNAFQWLERAVQERSLWIAWLAVDPRFDLFRRDVRYYSILERMKFPSA